MTRDKVCHVLQVRDACALESLANILAQLGSKADLVSLNHHPTTTQASPSVRHGHSAVLPVNALRVVRLVPDRLDSVSVGVGGGEYGSLPCQ